MEELFRKAAENYTPKKGESQWNKILPKLSGNSADTLASKKNNTKKYARLLSLFLLLMLFAGILVKSFNDKYEIAQLNKSSEKNNINNSDGQVNYSDKEKPVMGYKKQSIQKKLDHKINDIPLKESKNKIAANPRQITNLNIAKNYSEEKLNAIRNDDKNLTAKQNDLGIRIINQFNNDDSMQSQLEKNSTSFQKQRSIYVGLVTGPAFSEVKNQGIKKPGFDAGIIAGYRFNTKASVETGILLSKKKYFSDGKYFSMTKMPPGMKVINLEGSSTLFEVPVKFKYDVLHKKNAGVFSSAGISSYIITTEKNNYLVLLNGSEQKMNASYKNATKYFAAVADLSIGYENKIGKNTGIRIEPYLQIPLKGIGVGLMPVSSAGVHIGVVKFIR